MALSQVGSTGLSPGDADGNDTEPLSQFGSTDDISPDVGGNTGTLVLSGFGSIDSGMSPDNKSDANGTGLSSPQLGSRDPTLDGTATTRNGRLDGRFQGPVTVDETNDEHTDICPGFRHTGPVLYIDLVSEVGSHHSEDVQVVYKADYETVYQVNIMPVHAFNFSAVFLFSPLFLHSQYLLSFLSTST